MPKTSASRLPTRSAPVPASGVSAIGAATAGDPYTPTSGNTGYSVSYYDLAIDYRVLTNRLVATATITATTTGRLSRFSLDLAGLTVERLTVDGGRPKKTTQTTRKIVITLAEELPPDCRFVVVVRYRGAPRPLRSPWGELGWEELADGVLVAGQPIGAASWFPCNDHPGDKAGFRIQVVCEEQYTVISNGALVSRMSRSGRTTWVYESPEPMATYLATVQIGRFSVREAPASVPVKLFYPADLARKVAVDFASLHDMIGLFERMFGPYPFGSYSVVVTSDVLEIPLESQSLATFGRNHVDGAHGSERLIAHELAHQWFGNSLTVSRWRDIWLHEGLACYAEWLWSEASGGRSAQQNAVWHRKRLAGMPRDLVIGDPGAAEMFDDRVYKRGALAVHAIRRAIGDELFFAGLRDFAATHRHGNVTTEDFVQAMSALTGSDVVAKLTRSWVHSRGLPRL